MILDEVGRGTSTFDGLSIAWAVTEYLHDHPAHRPKTLFATHYHELTELESVLSRVKNYSVAVHRRGNEVIFLRRIVRGGAEQSYGIEVARLAGLTRAGDRAGPGDLELTGGDGVRAASPRSGGGRRRAFRKLRDKAARRVQALRAGRAAFALSRWDAPSDRSAGGDRHQPVDTFGSPQSPGRALSGEGEGGRRSRGPRSAS